MLTKLVRFRNLLDSDYPYLLSVTGLALVLRLYQLGAESLWGDEGCSIRDATYPNLAVGLRPVYYLILHTWMRLGLGGNEFFLRLPATIFGAAGVWVLFVLGRRLFDRPVALLASVFMAVSVVHINHSQEVRMYSLATLLVIYTTYLFVLWRDYGHFRYGFGYVISALLTLLTFPLTVFVFVGHAVFMLLYRRRYSPKSWMVLSGALIATIGWLPWANKCLQVMNSFQEGLIGSQPVPCPRDVISMLGNFFLWRCSNPSPVYIIGVVFFSLIVLSAALFGLRKFSKIHANVSLTWTWLVLPLLCSYVLSLFVTNVWTVRYVIAASPALYLLVSQGIQTLTHRGTKIAILILILLPTLIRLAMYYVQPERPEWRPAVRYVETHEEPGDIVGIYSPGNKLIFDYYYHGKSPVV
ncbi:MAG: glycosyltransferase family 39 protein, partial [Armatimonadota bacterium]